MRVGLCIPPPVAPDHPLLGVASLAAVLRQAGHVVRILDLNAEAYASSDDNAAWHRQGEHRWSDAKFLRRMEPFIQDRLLEFLGGAGENPLDVLGLHVTAAGRTAADLVANFIRRVRPNLDLVAGGPEYFIDLLEISPPAWARAVFVGEAEASLVEWLADPGAHGPIISARPIDLDELPAPDFRGFPLKLYRRSGVLPVETSRGCRNRCAFCDDARMWKRPRYRSHDSIDEQLERIEQTGATHVSFTDSMLNPTPRRFAGLCKILEQRRLTWDGMAQASGIDGQLAAAVARSGCKHLFLGVESFQQAVLQKLNKLRPSRGAEHAIAALARHGIGVSIGLIVAGPPLQSRAEFDADLVALRRAAAGLENVAVNPLCIPRGAPLWEDGPGLGLRGLASRESWRFWHSGAKLDDVRRRLDWCSEVMELLGDLGVRSGADHDDIGEYLRNQLEAAQTYFADAR